MPHYVYHNTAGDDGLLRTRRPRSLHNIILYTYRFNLVENHINVHYSIYFIFFTSNGIMTKNVRHNNVMYIWVTQDDYKKKTAALV